MKKEEVLTEEAEAKLAHKDNLKYWVELLRNPYWYKNENYIKDRIAKLELELQKIATKNNLDNAIASMALMRTIDELKKMLNHYKQIVNEKIHYDQEAAVEIQKQ